MTKADVIAGASGRPVPFAVPGAGSVLLRPLTAGDRAALFGWFKANEQSPGATFALQRKLVAAAVCDPAGVPVLAEADVDDLPAPAVDDIAAEVARRNGLGGDDVGKAPAPAATTPT